MLGVLIVCFILFFHLLLPKTCKSFVCLSNLLLMSVPVEDHSKKRVVRTTLDIYVCIKVVPYTSGKIWSARLIFLFFFLAVCLNISTVINIKILTNSNLQTQSY